MFNVECAKSALLILSLGEYYETKCLCCSPSAYIQQKFKATQTET